jgi:hypothetical protein
MLLQRIIIERITKHSLDETSLGLCLLVPAAGCNFLHNHVHNFKLPASFF